MSGTCGHLLEPSLSAAVGGEGSACATADGADAAHAVPDGFTHADGIGTAADLHGGGSRGGDY